MTPRARGTFQSHATLSLIGAGLSAVTAIATLPYIVSELGLPAYGLLSLLGVVSGYIGMLDLGFGWGTTRFLAEAIEQRDEERTKNVVSAGLSFHTFVGLFGCVVMGAASYPLIHWAFNVPPDLREPGIFAGLLFAAAFPFSMLHTFNVALFRGARRFGYASILTTLSSVGTGILMVLTLAVGGALVAICAATAAWQAVIAIAGTGYARQVYGNAYTMALPKRDLFVSLARFSLATSISSISSSLLYLPNRLAVGILLPLHAAGLFSAPLAVAQRLLVVPNTLVSAALPSLSAAVAIESDHAFWTTARKTLTWVLALLVPLLVLGSLWAPEILHLWLNIDSDHGPIILRLSLAAVLLNSITSVASVLCDSAGAPWIPAVASLVGGTVNVGLAFWLTSMYGTTGAALALPISIALMGSLMLLLWKRASLLRSPAAFMRGRNAVAAIATFVALTGYALAAAAVQHRLDSLLELASYSGIFLAAAYAIPIGLAARAAWRERHGVHADVPSR